MTPASSSSSALHPPIPPCPFLLLHNPLFTPLLLLSTAQPRCYCLVSCGRASSSPRTRAGAHIHPGWAGAVEVRRSSRGQTDVATDGVVGINGRTHSSRICCRRRLNRSRYLSVQFVPGAAAAAGHHSDWTVWSFSCDSVSALLLPAWQTSVRRWAVTIHSAASKSVLLCLHTTAVLCWADKNMLSIVEGNFWEAAS